MNHAAPPIAFKRFALQKGDITWLAVANNTGSALYRTVCGVEVDIRASEVRSDGVFVRYPLCAGAHVGAEHADRHVVGVKLATAVISYYPEARMKMLAGKQGAELPKQPSNVSREKVAGLAPLHGSQKGREIRLGGIDHADVFKRFGPCDAYQRLAELAFEAPRNGQEVYFWAKDSGEPGVRLLTRNRAGIQHRPWR